MIHGAKGDWCCRYESTTGYHFYLINGQAACGIKEGPQYMRGPAPIKRMRCQACDELRKIRQAVYGRNKAGMAPGYAYPNFFGPKLFAPGY